MIVTHSDFFRCYCLASCEPTMPEILGMLPTSTSTTHCLGGLEVGLRILA